MTLDVHRVSMATRVQAILGGLALIVASLWGVLGGDSNVKWLLGGTLAIPLGIVLIVGGLLPGRDARATLHAAKMLANLASPGSSPDDSESTPASAQPDTWANPSALRLASLTLWFLVICAVMLVIMAPIFLFTLFIGRPFEAIQGLSIAAVFGVSPLIKLARRVERSAESEVAAP